jgi:predicted Rossmann fold flavoprotein
MAGIWAGRAGAKVLLLDGAAKLGAKILVAGGGRCNVTHDEVSPAAYAGSSPNAIKKVLRRFDVPETTNFFKELGVSLKREATGKLFPTTNKAQTVLDALLRGVQEAGAVIWHPTRVEEVAMQEGGFRVSGEWGSVAAKRVILTTGGRSLPKSGSDGGGYTIAQALGHSLTERIFPALVPLTLPKDHFIPTLSGLTLPTTLTVLAGKHRFAFTDSTLCTHFGLSGPAVLDISRYYQAALLEKNTTALHLNWMPGYTPESIDAELQTLGKRTPLRWLTDHLPERLAKALVTASGATSPNLTRLQRQSLVQHISDLPLPITGNRGYNYAEVTAGGIPLNQLQLDHMESKSCPGLYLAGEICDVDGRIGGYNFQWAWSSGYVAGISAGAF